MSKEQTIREILIEIDEILHSCMKSLAKENQEDFLILNLTKARKLLMKIEMHNHT